MHRSVVSAILIALLTIVALSAGGTTLAQPVDGPATMIDPDPGTNGGVATPSTGAVNLLINGDMDQLGFYFRPKNHYVAGMWFEWWADYTAIPEYIDGGISYHNQCYPVPVDGHCHNSTVGAPNNSSQGYIRWGGLFAAGIYQPVHNVIPCTLYTFEIYNRNDTANYHAKVAIDRAGWIITQPSGNPLENCPPDGASPCPDPYVASFPSTTVWSAESHQPALTWAPISVTAEAAATTISVWTYAHPDSGPSQSAYWDYGSLVQTPFPDATLPAPASWYPSDFISNVTTQVNGNSVTINWETGAAAPTQVWYAIYEPAAVVTPTESMTYTTYLPIVAAFRPPTPTYMTPIDITSTSTQHQVVISGLPTDKAIVFAILSRRPDGTTCDTVAGDLIQLTLSTNEMMTLQSSKAATLLPGPVVPEP